VDELCMHDCLYCYINAALFWYVDCLKLSRAVISTLQYEIVQYWPRPGSAPDQLCSQEMAIMAQVPRRRFCELPIVA
jgi:hypothetical protein